MFSYEKVLKRCIKSDLFNRSNALSNVTKFFDLKF